MIRRSAVRPELRLLKIVQVSQPLFLLYIFPLHDVYSTSLNKTFLPARRNGA